MRDRTAKIFLIILSCLLISSCSLRWSYNLLDWLVAWEVDKYVSLDRQQKKQLHNSVDQFHQWHRQTQLPLYAKFLEQLESKLLDQKVDSGTLMQSFDQAATLWQDSLVEFTAFAPSLFLELSNKQITELIKNTTVETEAAVEKHMGRSEEQARDKKRKHMNKRLKKWLGKLTTEQKQLIAHWSLAINSNETLMVQARQEWQRQFNLTLSSDQSNEDFEQQVQTLLVYPERLWNDEYRHSVEHNRQLTLQLISDISHRLNRQQMRKLRKKLRNYIGDFKYLANH